MEETQKHPTDDTHEVGSISTAGELQLALERYSHKKNDLLLAEERLEQAQKWLLEKQLLLREAKTHLTDCIKRAYEVTEEAEASKGSLQATAPLIEPFPVIDLPPGIQFQDKVDPFEAPIVPVTEVGEPYVPF